MTFPPNRRDGILTGEKGRKCLKFCLRGSDSRPMASVETRALLLLSCAKRSCGENVPNFHQLRKRKYGSEIGRRDTAAILAKEYTRGDNLSRYPYPPGRCIVRVPRACTPLPTPRVPD